MLLDYTKLPEHIRSGVKLYIEEGIPPGYFLQAVICNNLKESFMYADEINIMNMLNIVSFFYNEVPMECWGSKEALLEWTRQGGMRYYE